MKDTHQPGLIGLVDIAVIVGLPILVAISWCVPVRFWKRIALAFAPFYGTALPLKRRPEIARRLRRTMGTRGIVEQEKRVVRDLVAEDILSSLELLHDYLPNGWRPHIKVSGLEHVETAIEKGRGAILWIGHFVHADLVAKMAFHRHGLSVVHLSHPRHGFSVTRFGMCCLNRIQTRIEDRYLRARIRMGLDSSTQAVEMLKARIGENGVVSISVRGNARKPAILPFLGGKIRIAAGAPVLAYGTGASLIPVFPVRETDGNFAVYFEAPLVIDRSRERQDAVGAALDQYVRALEDYVCRYPGQWWGWFNL